MSTATGHPMSMQKAHPRYPLPLGQILVHQINQRDAQYRPAQTGGPVSFHADIDCARSRLSSASARVGLHELAAGGRGEDEARDEGEMEAVQGVSTPCRQPEDALAD